MKAKHFMGAAIPFAILAAGGLAVWLSGFGITGYLTATSGDKGLQLEAWNVSLVSEYESKNFTYWNDDGNKLVSFVLEDNLNSTDLNCNYQPDKDIRFKVNGCYVTESSPCGVEMLSGNNTVQLEIEAASNRCPIAGNYSLGFVV